MNFRKNSYVVFFLAAVCIFAAGIFATTTLGQAACTGDEIFTQNECSGDANSSEENKLLELVNAYRTVNKRDPIKLSSSLSIVANRRMLDLKQNVKRLTHSWSNCPYDIKDKKTWPCVLEAPAKFNSGYNGQGYETLYRVSKGRVSPVKAVEAWGKSTLHNSIILNLGMFAKMPWDEVGIAIDGEYAALWFGYPGSGGKPPEDNLLGLGVSYDQAVAGLSKILSIDLTNSTVENNKWQGHSSDKKIKLEIFGTPRNISEADMVVVAKLDSDKKLSSKSQFALATLLKNLFPEWDEREAWLEKSIAAISADRTASRSKLVRKIAIELSIDGKNSLKLVIKPEGQQKYVEVY